MPDFQQLTGGVPLARHTTAIKGSPARVDNDHSAMVCFQPRYMHMSKVQRLRSLAASLVLLGTASLAAAQGIQMGTISGNVRSSDQQPLPGVTVTAISPNLQGESFAVSDANGVY